MIKITTQKQLENFLKKVSSNSLENAYQSIFENADPYVKQFKNNLKDEMEELKEEDEEEADTGGEEEEEAAETGEEETGEEETGEEETGGEEESGEKPNFAAEKALELIDYENDFDISFENVVTALNTMRAGKSTKNKKIKTELGDYYDRLSEDERALMLLYLNELSKVLTGATEGDDAQDPSEPSTYFNVARTNKKETKDSEEEASKEKNVNQDVELSGEIEKPEQQKSGEEDTTPPIKVNESQDMRLIYKKVRRLMRS